MVSLPERREDYSWSLWFHPLSTPTFPNVGTHVHAHTFGSLHIYVNARMCMCLCLEAWRCVRAYMHASHAHLHGHDYAHAFTCT